jgi:putative Holliday junction resolvase
MQRFLGIDFGLARIGLAVSYGTLAEPLGVLPNDEILLADIKALIKQYDVTDLVIGISEMEMAKLSQEFGEKLSKETGLPLHLQDEALTSTEVQSLLREKSKGKKQYRGRIDHFAAAKILERYLDDHPTNF